MNKQNDGGPAFPVNELNQHSGEVFVQHVGLSLRDYFAARAMQAFLTGHVTHYGHGNHWDAKDLASSAYDIADAMLRAPTPPVQHSDDVAVDRFAAAMKAKLARKRAEGRGGWDDPEQCQVDRLAELLHEHVSKGDPIDVANFAMMLWCRGGRTTPRVQQDDEALEVLRRVISTWESPWPPGADPMAHVMAEARALLVKRGAA